MHITTKETTVLRENEIIEKQKTHNNKKYMIITNYNILW